MLRLEAVEKQFDNQPVLRAVSLTISRGEVLVLLGPSGCGKTTLLRLIAGLETPDTGRILLNEKDLNGVPVYQRGFGFVFQDYALFPHKNVSQNVAFGLRMQNQPPAFIEKRVSLVLTLVGLAGFDTRQIHELSGGEQQRVALARSLAPAPRLLLLDEPLGALDRALRERLMLELRQILKDAGAQLGRPEGITAVYVTHDQAEAFAIADRIVVMNAGQVEQIGEPATLYQQPRTGFVARFLGMENVLNGEVVTTAPLCVQTPLGELKIEADPARELRRNDTVHLLIRPEAACLLPVEAPAPDALHGILENLSFRGRYQIAQVRHKQGLASLKLEFESDDKLPAVGDVIRFTLKTGSIVLLESG